MSLTRKPTTVKELKAALAKLPDSQKMLASALVV